MISCRVGGSWSLIKDYLKHFNHLTRKTWKEHIGNKNLARDSGGQREHCWGELFFRSNFDIWPLQDSHANFAPIFAQILISNLFRIFSCNLTRRLIPGASKCPKWRFLTSFFLIFPCSFIFIFAGERCSTASRVAKSDGSRSRGSSGSASQGLKIIIPQISFIWHLIVMFYIYQAVLLVKSYKKSGDRCWGWAEGEQSVEGGLRHHHRVCSSSST